ncbi:hypothetical protein [Halohasta litchfieldiae]|uniref:hypothetical protein n=1 Tax=Halohasta litchfieldiae TaxID=1073996 RepID=UPI00115FFB56|nr:hypothetical protein [Halohasta litchfieldiae]
MGTGQQTDRPECGGNWAHRQDHSPAVVRPPTDHSNEWLTTGSLTTAMTPAVGCGSRPKWRLEWTPIVGVQQWADNTDRLRRLVA